MGTSTSYSGPGGANPLIPSWLDSTPDTAEPVPVGDDDHQGQDVEQPAPEGPRAGGEVLHFAKFAPARGRFSRYVKSSSPSRQALGRAISSYASRSGGGSSAAATRMGASRATGGRLLGFLADAQSRGAGEALRALNLSSLVGKSASDIFFGLADYVCSTEGTTDAGIAREAYIETVAEVLEAGMTTLDELTSGQVGVMFEGFMANSIFAKLCNDIGTGIVQLPQDARTAIAIQNQIKEYIRGSVRDALGTRLTSMDRISQTEALRITNDLYVRAFSILSSYADS